MRINISNIALSIAIIYIIHKRKIVLIFDVVIKTFQPFRPPPAGLHQVLVHPGKTKEKFELTPIRVPVIMSTEFRWTLPGPEIVPAMTFLYNA